MLEDLITQTQKLDMNEVRRTIAAKKTGEAAEAGASAAGGAPAN